MREPRAFQGRVGRIALAVAMTALTIPDAWGGDDLVTPQRLATSLDKRRLSDDMKVKVTVGGLKKEFNQLEPIPLEIVVTNLSSSTACSIGAGYGPECEYRVVRLRVFDRKGDLLPETRWQSYNVKYGGYQVGGSMVGMYGGTRIEKGKDVRSDVFANLAYDMTSPGEYSILVEFPTGEKRMVDGVEVPAVAQSTVVKVKVLAEGARLPLHMMKKP